jgi:DNA-binding response OmpR family regulator
VIPNWIRATRLEELSRAGSATDDQLILLIESDPHIADMFALGLRQGGYPVAVANSSESISIEVDQAHVHPRAIILDLELPPRRGLDLLSALRRSPGTADVPVIVLGDDTDEFTEAYRRGATECHEKHRTTPRLLVSYVSAAVGGGRRVPSP